MPYRNDLESRVYEGADVIDSRDIIERIEELEAQRPDLECSCDTPDMATCGECGFQWCDRCNPTPSARCHNEDNHEDEEEFRRLKALAEEAEGSGDWQHGEALISDSYFETYAQELAEDIGAISRDATWPANHIDWKAAAEALQQDYTSVEYGSTTYWLRS